MSEHGTQSRYVRGCRCPDCTTANRTYARRRDVYGWSERVAEQWADAQPVRDHIAGLRAAGMGTRRIARKAGVHRSALDAILRGRSVDGPAKRILRRNADAILAVRPDVADGALVDPTGSVRRIRAMQAMGWPLSEIATRIAFTTSNLGTIASGVHGVTAGTARKIAAVYGELSMTPGPSTRSKLLAERRGWLPPLAWDDDTIDDPAAWGDLGGDAEDLVDEEVVRRLVEAFPERVWRDLGATKDERIAAAEQLDAIGRRTRAHLSLRDQADTSLAGPGRNAIERALGVKPGRDFAVRDEDVREDVAS